MPAIKDILALKDILIIDNKNNTFSFLPHNK
jgi:hypothetical protein